MEKPESSIPPKVPVALSYQSDESRPPLRRWHVVVGCLVTTILLVALCVVAGFTHFAASYSKTMDGVFLYFAGATVGLCMLTARRFRRNEFRRGWGLGIYLGMGLAALFWGYCGIFLYRGV